MRLPPLLYEGAHRDLDFDLGFDGLRSGGRRPVRERRLQFHVAAVTSVSACQSWIVEVAIQRTLLLLGTGA